MFVCARECVNSYDSLSLESETGEACGYLRACVMGVM